MPEIQVPPFTEGLVIVDPKTGRPTIEFHKYWQRSITNIVSALNSVIEAQEAADAANAAAETATAAAETAQDAADGATAASDLANSYIANFTPPVVQADSTGNVTIANHDRVYGDGTTVSITGAVVATGQVNPVIVYIYYDDATRADTTPTFAYTTVEGDAAQIGDRHNVGAVTIPVAGTQDGGYARPPGYGGIQP